MQSPRLYEATKDTVIELASDRWGDRLAQLYGFPRPPRWPQGAWMKALREVSFGRRDTFENLLLALEHVFSMWDPLLTVSAELEADRLVAPEETFSCFWEHRWVRVRQGDSSQRLMSLHVVEEGDELFLVPNKILGAEQPALLGEVTVTLLPFWVVEDDVKGRVTVQIDGDALGFPATYLFPEGDRHESLEGIGGILMPDSIDPGEGIPAIYLSGEGVVRALRLALRAITPAGIKLEIVSRRWCAEGIELPPLP